MKKKRIKKLLLRSLDWPLKPKKERKITEMINRIPELMHEKQQIVSLRNQISSSSKQTLSAHFADRVLELVAGTSSTVSYLESMYQAMVPIFRRLVFFTSILAVALLVYNLILGNYLPYSSSWILTDLTLQEILELPLL